ncbi:MAG: class I SAM-dependent methyltransferase [Thermoplasmatales archaeon]
MGWEKERFLLETKFSIMPRSDDERSKHRMFHGNLSREDPTSLIEKFGIKNGMRVVDLGSGIGFYTIPIAKAVGPGGQVFALDIDLGSLQSIKDRTREDGISNVSVMRCNIEMLPFKDKKIDVVFLANVFHDVDDRNALLMDINRVLKRPGLVIDFDWADIMTDYGPPLYLRINENVARKTFEEAGFRTIRSMHIQDHHYALIFALS